MKNTFNSGNQFWSEIAGSAGLISKLAVASSCLTANETAICTGINAISTGYWKPAHINQFITILRKVMVRYPGAAD